MCNKSHIYVLHLPPHNLSFLIVVFFHRTSYSPPAPLFSFHTFHISSLFSSLSFFPLELSLHTIANNLVKESHLCSHVFLEIPIFPSLLTVERFLPVTLSVSFNVYIFLNLCFQKNMYSTVYYITCTLFGATSVDSGIGDSMLLLLVLACAHSVCDKMR